MEARQCAQRPVYFLTFLALACSPVEPPRTAFVERPGGVGFNESFTPTIGHGHAAYEYNGQSRTANGDGGAVPLVPRFVAGYVVGLIDFGLQVGVVPGCEVGVNGRILGIQGEVRCQPIGYGRRGPVALALSAGGGAWAANVPPYLRGGLDLTFAGERLGLLTGLYLRTGETHHGLVDSSIPPDPNDANPNDNFTRSLHVDRQELRISIPVGVAWFTTTKPANRPFGLVFGLVPSFVLHASSIDSARCADCDPAVHVTSYKEDFSVAAVVRLEISSRPKIPPTP